MSKNYLIHYENRKLPLLENSGVKLNDFERDVEILKTWAKQQSHLPKDYQDDDAFIERLLVNNKFRIEQSKIKYDNYFTMKGIYSSLFDGIENVVPSTLPVVKIPLRKFTNDGKLILLLCVTRNDDADTDFEECLKFQLIVSEIVNKYCYTDGRVAILDFKGLKTGFFKNFDIVKLHQHLKLIKNCFSGRISAVHVVNATNFANMLLAGIKMVLQSEVIAKIKIHDSMDSLHKDVPQNLLPKEYGGDDISIREYLDIWDSIIKEERSFLRNLRNQVADESLRIGPTHLSSTEFGVDGTFKKLNLD